MNVHFTDFGCLPICLRLLLTEVGLAFRYERVSPYQGGTLSPEHRARNSLGKIPTLRDTNGAEIAESQAICRYLARVYPEVRRFYPIDDPVLCAQVDTKNDFITFSLGGPFFNWFVFSAYFPKAWGLKVENEAHIYSLCSVFLVKGGLARLVAGSDMAPFVPGKELFLPDFQLFHTLELSRTFSELFEMPMLNLVRVMKHCRGSTMPCQNVPLPGRS
ncbi:MAG: glutathione S-transferase family protein [Pyrinomonadaceae bacterium]